MSLNEGFSETFIFWIKNDIFKVLINFTKGMYTVYAPNGRILIREEKVPHRKLLKLKKEISDHMKNNYNGLPSLNYRRRPFTGYKV